MGQHLSAGCLVLATDPNKVVSLSVPFEGEGWVFGVPERWQQLGTQTKAVQVKRRIIPP
jgi:hypothetical protein